MDYMGYVFVKAECTVRNILVTGASGYLGSELVSKIKTMQGINVLGTGRAQGDYLCDLADLGDVNKLLIDSSPDLILHCAANVPKNMEDYNKDSTNSLLMVENLLKASVVPIVFVSSMTVYGPNVITPVHESSTVNPESRYALSKWKAEKLIKQYQNKAMIIRIPGLFGSSRINGVVANMIISLNSGQMPTKPTKQLLWSAMHVKDAADSIIKLSLSKWEGVVEVNVGYQDICSISRVFEMLNNIYKMEFIYTVKHPDFQFDLTRYNKIIGRQHYNINTALKLFGEELSVS